ncbi:unnamed protein product [Heterobilharzia americana]|nr:unnamed protein product [Heterobilharzia americana]
MYKYASTPYLYTHIITTREMSTVNESLIVIGAGLPRTGTMSTKKALEILLSQPCYHMSEIVMQKHCDISKWQKLIDDAQQIPNEPLDQKLLNEIFDGYTSVTDAPACGFYKYLMNLYPNSKVILTIRDKNDWLSSIRQTVLPKTNTPDYMLFEEAKQTIGLGPSFTKMVDDSMRFTFQKPNMDLDNDEELLACFDEHNKRVMETVPEDRLLVYQLGDGWEPLCKFLNIPVPQNIPFPHVNDRAEMKSRIELIKKQAE